MGGGVCVCGRLADTSVASVFQCGFSVVCLPSGADLPLAQLGSSGAVLCYAADFFSLSVVPSGCHLQVL